MFWVIFLFAYQLFQLIALPLCLPYFLVKNLGAATEQTGFVPSSNPDKKIIWIHGLSAGEITSVQELVTTIKRELPGTACYITAGTEEGKKIAQQQVKADYVSLLPHDDILAMSLAFGRINPRAIILLEHEVKPTVIMLARLKSIPVYLLNAQYTSQTAKNLSTFSLLYKDLYNSCDKIFVQTDNDKMAFKQAGILDDKLFALGNIKAYNVLPKKQALLPEIAPALETYKNTKKNIVLLLGSVHRGEIDQYLKLFSHYKKEHKNLKLIIAPRFLDWKDELVAKVKATGYSYTLWDETTKVPSSPEELVTQITGDVLEKSDIFMPCVLGKLFNLYPLADIFFLGGTFVPVGGHNMLEPAVWSNPIIFGPYDENTRDIAEQLKACGGALQVSNEEALFHETKKLLDDKLLREKIGHNAYDWLATEAGRVKDNISLLIDTLKLQGFEEGLVSA